jgi:hypothetical protein
MNHHVSLKDQVAHILSGTLIFIIIGAISVLLDLAASWVKSIGVTEFTHYVLTQTAHGLLILDTGLFLIYIFTSGIQLAKGMFK